MQWSEVKWRLFIVTVGFFSLLSSNSTLYGQVIMFFAEPALNYLISFNTCFEIEGSELTVAAKIDLLDETLGVS